LDRKGLNRTANITYTIHIEINANAEYAKRCVREKMLVTPPGITERSPESPSTLKNMQFATYEEINEGAVKFDKPRKTTSILLKPHGVKADRSPCKKL
jgi:hypothetical protein